MIVLLAALALAGEPIVGRDLPGEVMPDRHWDFLHLDLEVKLDPDAGTVVGTATHRVRPLGPPHGWVRLHQVGLDIQEVTLDGAPVTGWRVGEQTLDVPVSPDGAEHVVSVRYTATPQTGMHFRGGRGTSDPIREIWTQGEGEENRYWFPTWDHPNDKFTVATAVTVPDGLLAFANGELEGSGPAEPGWTRWSWRLNRPIVSYLVAIAAGEYAAYDDASEVPLTYIVPRTTSEAAARRSLAVTAEQMPFFSDLLGHPFPYPVYRQVFVSRFLYGGMENATLTVLSDRLLLSHPTARDRSTEEVVAHELAHQWFGDLLTCYGWRELWLNEGFASFYTGRWLEHRYGADRYALAVRRWMRHALHDPAPMAARAWSKVDGRENAAVYVRGAAVLHMLRTLLGDATFDAAIRRYVADNADRLVVTEDLRRALEETSGTHLGWLFDQWVHGVGNPQIATRWRYDDGAVEVVLDQTTEGSPFSAPVTIEIGLADDIRRRQVWLGAGETRLVLELPTPPQWVAVDAPGGVLAHWTHEQPVDAWAAQARHSPTAYARIVAIEQLGDGKATRTAVEALRGVLHDGAIAPDVRRVAAESLGKLGTSDARAALLAVIEADDPDIREAVVEALGKAPPDATDIATVLARRTTVDLDPYVRAAALSALGHIAPSRAVGMARQRLNRADPTPVRVEHVAALAVLGAHAEAADLDAILRRVVATEHRDTRHTAAEAAAAVLERLDDRQRDARRTAVVEPLLDLLNDRDIRSQQLAIRLLGRVGDEAAEAALTVYARQTTVSSPDLATAALDAARLVRTRDPVAPTEQDTEDLVRLRQRLEELEGRLERLEEWR